MQATKESLRQQVSARLKLMTQGERAIASARARALLAGRVVWQQAASILFFAPLPDELDIWPLLPAALAAGKLVALPRFVAETDSYTACQIHDPDTDLRPGRFGIREPATRAASVELQRLDLILAPGVAFDLCGRRLGRGKGYYDRLLATLRGTTCGVAFDQQIVDEAPLEAHDIQMDYLLTPTRWVSNPRL